MYHMSNVLVDEEQILLDAKHEETDNLNDYHQSLVYIGDYVQNQA